MKTPERMAEEWVGRNRSYPYRPEGSTDKCVKAAFLAGYKAAQGWISVEDRLPTPEVPVLCIDGLDDMYIDYKLKDGQWDFSCDQSKCTHWMPLPPAPKEEP
jgi:hypothetical protein